MEFFCNRERIEERLTFAFKKRYKRKDAALTGILLARPQDRTASEAVLPNLEFWHYRSDYYTDFFCAGYIPVDLDPTAKPVGVTVEGRMWGFSLPSFVEIVEALEREAKWRYNGDACLLLLSAYFDGTKAHLDFRRCLRLNFREALEDRAIGTPTEIADAIFEIAKGINESKEDPVWELSNRLGHKVIKSGVKDAFLALLPPWLSPSTRRAMHFVVHQVGGET